MCRLTSTSASIDEGFEKEEKKKKPRRPTSQKRREQEEDDEPRNEPTDRPVRNQRYVQKRADADIDEEKTY